MLIATPTPAYRQAGVPSPVRDCVVIVILPPCGQLTCSQIIA